MLAKASRASSPTTAPSPPSARRRPRELELPGGEFRRCAGKPGRFFHGAYSTTDTPHRLWAAAEMWETTGDPTILSNLETRITAEGTKCDNDFDWANPKNLASSPTPFPRAPGAARPC